MSHIAEVYAKELGVKIGRPQITEHYYPGLPDRYITLHSSNKMPASVYKYWDIVIWLLSGHLIDNDIQIVQVGGPKDKPIQGIGHNALGASFKQMNYILKGSMAHVGCDSLPGHVSSVYDVPSVILHYNLYKENSKPLWHNKNKCISLEPDFSKVKPSFSDKCQRINDIKPEDIAQSILDQLNIDKKIDFKTLRIGQNFQEESIDVIPNFFSQSQALYQRPINVRADLHFDINNIIQWCQFCIVNLHTDTVVPTEALDYCGNLKQIIFRYSDKHEDLDLNSFFTNLKRRKINLIIKYEGTKDISDVRFKYFDYPVAPTVKVETEHKQCKFLSKKSFITDSQQFTAEFTAKKLDNSDNFVYDDISSEELESFYLYE